MIFLIKFNKKIFIVLCLLKWCYIVYQKYVPLSITKYVLFDLLCFMMEILDDLTFTELAIC